MVGIVSLSFGTNPVLDRYEYSELHMGVKVRVTLYASSETRAEDAARAAFDRFAELEDVMSDYRPTSEVMRLCDQAGKGPVKVSADLFRVLQRAAEVSRLSDGAFDVTAGPLVKLWRQARKDGFLPTPEAIARAKAFVGWQAIVLNRRDQTVEITKPGVRIDLGGIAKGDALDQSLAVLSSKGIRSALVEAGGDLAASGPPPGHKGWRISINAVREPIGNLGLRDGGLTIAHQAVSTSGDTEQYVVIGGVRYSHIVDT
ncbi:MAG: FAD:protein FMN transferase, partial [Fimbriimonas sp.]